MEINQDLVRKVAKLAKLELGEGEIETMRVDLRSILDYVETLDELDTEKIQPFIHPNNESNKFRSDKPIESLERDLMLLFPRKDWTLLAHLLISHGRKVCIARRPQCTDCVLADRCPSAQLPV